MQTAKIKRMIFHFRVHEEHSFFLFGAVEVAWEFVLLELIINIPKKMLIDGILYGYEKMSILLAGKKFNTIVFLADSNVCHPDLCVWVVIGGLFYDFEVIGIDVVEGFIWSVELD